MDEPSPFTDPETQEAFRGNKSSGEGFPLLILGEASTN